MPGCCRLAVFIALLCSPPAWAGEWLFQHSQWQSGGGLESQRETRLQYFWQGDGHEGHVRFAYQPLHLGAAGRFPEAAHNGHLYEYGLRLQRQWPGITLGVEVGAHISSNMFIHADWREEALVSTFDVQLGKGDGWRPGVSGDYRSGRFLIYPILHRQWQSAAGSVAVELPNGFEWRSVEQEWSIIIERHGQRWGVLDSERQQASRVYLNEWRFQLRRHWSARPSSGKLEASLGFSADRRLRYRQPSGAVSRVRPDDRLFLSLAWLQPF